jgi:hypothetical protein
MGKREEAWVEGREGGLYR